ncbi:MAG TPA: AmmeMemoRadiSam system protein A [Thermoanaerobaculia bacterium]|nr:AmmeMemoRadiSam system protein A [Thermoanaerobaculia bacterium]
MRQAEDSGEGPIETHQIRGCVLLSLARQAIAEALGALPAPAVADADLARELADWLAAPGATFVTLTVAGQLRGCIGSLSPCRTLAADVRANARAAALADPRFAPLTAAELPAARVEVSLLSPPEPLPAVCEEEALAALRPGLDGVVLECGEAHGTFLPQVWEHFAEPREFLAQLKHKAGLPRDYWSPDLRLWRYRVVHWQERDT